LDDGGEPRVRVGKGDYVSGGKLRGSILDAVGFSFLFFVCGGLCTFLIYFVLLVSFGVFCGVGIHVSGNQCC
jgi:hypothetical protein